MTNNPRTPRGQTCQRCGVIHPGCTGHRSRDGQPCKQNPIDGLTVCKFHGGGTKAARAAGARRVAQQEAETWLMNGIQDAPPLRNLREVYDELLTTGGQISYARQKLAIRVGNLESLDYEARDGEQTRADMMLFERFLDRSMKFAELVIKLNIEERRQALSETEGQLLADVTRRILDRLNLTEAQRALVGTVVSEEVHALTARTSKEPA